MAQLEGYLTVKEAGEKLGVSGGRIRQFIAEGRLESLKLGQMRVIRESDLESVKERIAGRPKKSESKK